jgi:hypothetical protein
MYHENAFQTRQFLAQLGKPKNGRRKMSDYKQGSMDISSQEKTFAGFIKGGIWLAGISIGVLVFLAVFNA